MKFMNQNPTEFLKMCPVCRKLAIFPWCFIASFEAFSVWYEYDIEKCIFCWEMQLEKDALLLRLRKEEDDEEERSEVCWP
jgi:hypothetical protein